MNKKIITKYQQEDLDQYLEKRQKLLDNKKELNEKLKQIEIDIESLKKDFKQYCCHPDRIFSHFNVCGICNNIYDEDKSKNLSEVKEWISCRLCGSKENPGKYWAFTKNQIPIWCKECYLNQKQKI